MHDGRKNRHPTQANDHLNAPITYVIMDGLHPELRSEKIQAYWLFQNDIEVINGIGMKDRRIIVPTVFQLRTFEQLHINHTGIEKTR